MNIISKWIGGRRNERKMLVQITCMKLKVCINVCMHDITSKNHLRKCQFKLCTLPFEKYQFKLYFSMQTTFKKDQLSTVFTIYINHSSQQIGLLHKSYSYLPSWKRRQLVHPTPDNQSKLLTTAHEPTNYSQVGACLAAYSYAYPAPPLHAPAPPSTISTSTLQLKLRLNYFFVWYSK
jgi:hypothetical protein